MNRESFVAHHSHEWTRLESMLDALDRSKPVDRPAELPELYRRACHHLALVRQRQLGLDLERRLNGLALRGVRHLYRKRTATAAEAAHFLVVGFPRLVRSQARLFWFAFALLFGPALGMGLLAWLAPETAYSVVSPAMLERMEEMYSGPVAREGGASDDLRMFGFYVRNNVGIGFRTFAGGLPFGLGTVFILTNNGLHLGAIAAHLSREGMGERFWTFVVAHGSFELIGFVLAGAAGLRLGLSLLAPGRRTRVEALKGAARVSARLALGAAVMIFLAAFIEAFWSARADVPTPYKLLAGGLCWFAMTAWLVGAGRRGP